MSPREDKQTEELSSKSILEDVSQRERKFARRMPRLTPRAVAASSRNWARTRGSVLRAKLPERQSKRGFPDG